MAITFNNTSASSLLVTNQLNKNSKKLGSINKQLSSGQKDLTSSSSGSALLAKIEMLNSAIDGLGTSNSSITQANEVLQTATGGLNAQLSQLQDIRNLAVQASNDFLSSSERESLNNSLQSSLAQFDQTAQSLEFGGTKLLDGSFTNKNIQVGAQNGNQIQISISGSRSADLSLNTIDISNSASVQNSIDTIDQAISSVVSNLSNIGSTQNRLERSYEANSSASISMQVAVSDLGDTDIASLTPELTSETIKREAMIKVLEKSNESEKSTFQLIV